MAIIHIVMFEFKPTIHLTQVNDVSVIVVSTKILLTYLQVADRMMALKDKCIHPSTKKNYIKYAQGGRNNSPEGLEVVLAPSLLVTSCENFFKNRICLIGAKISWMSRSRT